MLHGYRVNDVPTEPRTRLVALHAVQLPRNDLSQELAARNECAVFPSVTAALTLGGSELAVDAVLLVGEHGNYPRNEYGQKQYPRYELFHEILDVFKTSSRVVPVFSDKHLSYSWTKAKDMYDAAAALHVPFAAGSSIPLTPRTPPLTLPLGAPLTHAVAVGYGELEDYGFHTLEVLQCMAERRRGGETGIAAVEALRGDDVWRWRASAAGKWSAPLLDAALARTTPLQPGRPEDSAPRPFVFIIEYRDGFKGAAYMLDRYARDWCFAGKISGHREPVSTCFGPRGPARDLPHFDGLVHVIEELFVTGRPAYPVERTLLTSGALDFLMRSLHDGRRLLTPELKLRYQSPRQVFVQTA